MKAVLCQFLNKQKDDVLKSVEVSSWGDWMSDGESLEDRLYVSFLEVSVQFLFESDDDGIYRLSSIFLSRGEFVEQNLSDLIGFRLQFNQGRSRVRKELGEPAENGKFGQKTILGVVPPWDKFFIGPDCALHFEYDFDSSKIERITVQRR